MNINEERQFKILEWVWKHHPYYFLEDKVNSNKYELKPNADNGKNNKDFIKKADAILEPLSTSIVKKYFIQNTSFSHKSKIDNFRKKEMQAYKSDLNNIRLINQINSQEQGKELIESLLFELVTEIRKKLDYDFILSDNDEAILFVTCNTRLMFENNSAYAFSNIIGGYLHNNFRHDNRIYHYSKIIIVFNVNILEEGSWFPPILFNLTFKQRDTINDPKIFQIKLNLMKQFGLLEIVEAGKLFVYQNISMNPIYMKKIKKKK